MAIAAAGKGGRAWGDALLGRPWLLVLAVALFVAVPVLVVGQASENDTRTRLSAAQAESAANAASAVTSTVNDRYENVRDALAGLALKPRPEESLVALAVQRGDTATLQLLADTLLYNPNVRRAYVAVRGDAATIADATVVVQSPRGTEVVGLRLSELTVSREAVLAVVANTPSFETGAFTVAYPGNATSPSRTNVIASISTSQAIVARTGAGVTTAPATIVVEIENARLFGGAAAPSLGSSDDAYLLDRHRWLIGRGRGPVVFPLRDLSADPFVGLLQGEPLVRSSAADPLGGGTRMIAAARLSGSDSWVLLLRDTTVVDREIDAVLGQLATARYVLVALLLIGAVLVSQAAGTQIRQRRALAVANERIEAASLHKSAFLSSMSHELRTPLNSINGFSDVLLSGIGGTLTEKQREYLADIRGSGEHLLALVNDVLDLSRVEAGKMDLHPTEFDLREMIEAVHRVVAPLAQQKGQRLELEIGDVGTVRLDQGRLRQVLLNVVSNAVKYTPDGGQVTTTVSKRDGAFHIAVRDTGVGIAKADQARIFDDFTRIESGYARTQQGTGLGLSLARRLVRLMGGDITLDSEPGRGSTFTITVPAA